MKRLSLLFAAILILSLGSYAQRGANRQLIQRVNEQMHPRQMRNSIVPEKALYHQDNDGLQLYRDKFNYEDDTYYLLNKETSIDNQGEWAPYALTTYEYGFDELPIEEVLQVWDGDWVNSIRHQYSYEDYNLTSLISEDIEQEWVNGNWVNLHQIIYGYEPIITAIVKDWNGNNWENHYLYTFEFGENEETVLIQYWQGGAWQNMEQEFYYYDNDIIQRIIYQDWENSTWVNAQRDAYEYDGIYKLNTVTKTPWMNGDWAVNESTIINYTYDGMGNNLHAVTVNNESTYIEMYYNEGDMMSFYNVVEVTMEYFDITGIGEQEALAHFSLSPNPCEGRFEVRGANFKKAEVYSLTGQKIAESESPVIELQTMASGVYLVKVSDIEGHSEVCKMMVR